jgi:L-lactate dehydrogenase
MKISIIGAGFVGSTTAYRILLANFASEIVLVDRTYDKAEGEAFDLSQSASFGNNARVRSGEYKDIEGSSFVIVTAGRGRKPGEDRTDMIKGNLVILKELIPELVKYAPKAYFIIVSNPADTLTYATLKYSDIDPKQIIGSGTVIDSSRFRSHLADYLEVSSTDVQAYTIGEHGNTQVPVFSQARIGGIAVETFAKNIGKKFDTEVKEQIKQKTVNSGAEVIARKGATFYAIASSICEIVEAVHKDKKTILPVCSLLNGQYGINNVCLSSPSIIGRNGVEKVLEIDLNEDEGQALKKSAETVKSFQDLVD